MHIDELENYNLADAVRFHDELNPGLWGKDEHLRPEVREALLRIADDFREFLGVSDLEVKDITISGSNAAYNYTPNSDIDLHLVVDIPELSDEVYRELFNAKKYQYNDQHDIRIRGADVELYVQPAEDTHVSQGIYSVAQQKWLSVPRRKRAEIDDNSVRHKAEDLEARIQQAIGSGDREVMDRLWQKIKDIRKSGLEQKGEFSTENLVFKILRVNGLIEKLQTARQSARDQELSLNERKRKKSRKRYAYGGYWYPGFGYAGSSEAGSDSGGDGGGESVREDVGSTWDGVSPTTRMFTSEQEQDNNKNVIKTFARFVAKQIGMKQLPRIRITRDPKWSAENGTFGHYDQNRKTLTISLANRHIMDVLRTMAHELVHAHQDTKHKLPAAAGKTGSPYENEANAVAGRIMRRWAQKHGNMFDEPAMEDYDPNAAPPGPETKPTMPAGTVRVDVSDVYDWYKLGQHISNLKGLGKHDFGKGPPSAIISFGDEDTEHQYIKDLEKTGLSTTDIDPRAHDTKKGQKTDPTYDVDEDLKSTLGAAAAAACIAGTPGCATTDTSTSPTADVLRGVQTVGRTAQTVKDMGVGGAKEELINQLRDKLRGIREATGYIPTKKQARDPRFSMALTQDIRPGQIGKEANKLNLKTDSQGHPALLMSRLNNLLESVKTGEQLDEDELFELKMSPSNLARMAKNIDARVGMEFELIVPGVEDEEEEFESEPDYDADESFPMGPGWQRDVIEFFRGGSMGNSTSYIQRRIDELNDNFYEWLGDQEEEFLASNEGQERAIEIATSNVDREDFETDEEYETAVREYLIDEEDHIRDTLIDEFRDDLDSKFEEWLDDQGINSMADFANEYNLEWPYWTESEYYGGGGISIENVADDFSDAIGRPVNSSGSYHGATRQPGKYVVEPDSSLHGNNGESGLEFVSPPLTVDEMLSDIDKVAKWAGRVGAYTNDSTGLHMNVSVPGQKNLDFVKLAMFLGDNYILEQFGREGNTYCKGVLKQIVLAAKSDPSRVEEMMRQFQNGLNQLASKILHTGSTGKYSSINNRGNWIEFRGPGGDWLGDDLSAVKNTLLRAVVATDVATKPEEFKQEYYKKLYKTLSEGKDNDVIQYFAKYAAGELPQSALKAFVRQIQGKRKIEKMTSGAKDILLVWKVTGDPENPYQSQGTEVVAQDEIGAFREAIKKWGLSVGNLYIDEWAERNGWRAQPLRAATTADLNQHSNKFYRVYPENSQQGVWVRAMSEFQAKNLAVDRFPGMFTSAVTFDDIIADHDPNYSGPETAFNLRDRSGPPAESIYQIINNADGEVLVSGDEMSWAAAQSAANNLLWNRRLRPGDLRIVDLENNRSYDINGQLASASTQMSAPGVGGEQSSDANYEIVDRRTMRPVFRFIANTDSEAQRKYDDWLAGNGLPEYTEDYGWRRIENRGIPGSTAELQRQRAEQLPSRDQEFTGIWEVVSRNTDEVVHNISGIGNAVADAERYARRWQEQTGFDDPVYVRPLMRARDNLPRNQGEPVPARGTESLPPGNTRWLVLDPNDREVYSFVHRSNQGEANMYAANWLRSQGLLGSSEFMVVPAR